MIEENHSLFGRDFYQDGPRLRVCEMIFELYSRPNRRRPSTRQMDLDFHILSQVLSVAQFVALLLKRHRASRPVSPH